MPLTHYKRIAIEGSIGAGKSSLTKKLAEKLDYNTVWEVFENNTYLNDFYNGNKSNVFQLEVSMLLDRINELKKTEHYIADFWLQKSLVFASINLSNSDNLLFQSLYEQCVKNLKGPSLVIYLESDVEYLIQNIQNRNRAIEQNINPNYLINLNNAYEKHIHCAILESPILIINVEKFDFVNNKNDLGLILNKLKTKMLPGIHRLKK